MDYLKNWLLLCAASLVFGLPSAGAQSVGTVTALQGQAQLTRAGTRSGLRFRDGLILRDGLDTREQSLVRILFGGKSTVTVRELSHLDVREELVPGGGTRTTHDLSAGEILLRVVRQLMSTGDEVQIQTPNAVAAVRGTTLYARYVPQLNQTTFTVINGLATVTPLGLAAIDLTTGQSVTITGAQTSNIVAGAIRNISPAESAKIIDDAEVTPAFRQEAARDATARDLGARAAQERVPIDATPCWPFLLCQGQRTLAGALVNVPVPVGSSTGLGSKANSGVRSYFVLAQPKG